MLTITPENELHLWQGIVQEQERQAAIKDSLRDPSQLTNLFGLKSSSNDVPRGIPWFDFASPDSPYRTMWECQTESLQSGKGLCVFGPRGIGKSGLSLVRLGGLIAEDRSYTVRIAAFSKREIEKRSNFLRGAFINLENVFGAFRSSVWQKQKFNVIRPPGQIDETVTLTSPDSPGTGAHPRLFLVDDLVDDEAEQSEAKMLTTVNFFKALGCQEMEGTVTWVVGTFRWGWNAYKYIIEKLEGGLRLQPRGKGFFHEGRAFDILLFRDLDENAVPIFACQSKGYLERKQVRVGKAMYNTQFRMMLGTEDDITFGAKSVVWGNPPKGTAIRTCILTDTATSSGRSRHTSITALGAISKTPDNHAWAREIRMGNLSPERVPEIIFDMWKRHGAEKIVYELNSSAAQAYMGQVRNLFRQNGVLDEVLHRTFLGIARAADKHFRIQTASPYAAAGMLHVSPEIAREVLRIGEDGRLEGLLGQQLMTYRYGAPGSWDGMDMFGDIWGEESVGVPIFRAPGAREKAKKVE